MDASSFHSGSAPLADPFDLPFHSIATAHPPHPIDMPEQQQQQQPRRKRSSSDRSAMRSFKRLRLDPSRNTLTQHDCPSTGTLSVGTYGTMGADLESNDDDDCDEEEESNYSESWVASLSSKSRRMTATNGSMHNYDQDNDDTATCAEMTTAAVAPKRRRRRVHHHNHRTGSQTTNEDALVFVNGEQERKRRGIDFAFNSQRINHESNVGTKEIEDTMLDSTEKDAKEQHQRSSCRDAQIDYSTPPVECIPDPLLVAAQHAAVLGGDSDVHREKDSAGLFVGDCYSSVTEEETSLAEDEASLSAVSYGNVSVGPNGGVVSSVKEEELKSLPSLPSSDDAQKTMGRYNNLNSFLGNLHRERQQRHSSQSMHASPHKRGPSYHSLGSMGVQSNVSGTSHRSLPMDFETHTTNIMNQDDMDVDEGPTGSISSARGNQQQEGGEQSRTLPKWKRRVKLPSHSSLY